LRIAKSLHLHKSHRFSQGLRAHFIGNFSMAHIVKSVAERSAPSRSLGVSGKPQHAQSTPRVYAFQPRKGRLNTRSVAQIDVRHIIENSDHAMLQQCLREVVFGKVRHSSVDFRYNATTM
jgi:hypothetical protein